VVSILDAALATSQAGWAITPLVGKQPVIAGWTSQRFPRGPEIYEWFDHGDYVAFGVRCGEISGGLVVIDIEGRLWADADRMARILKVAESNSVADLLMQAGSSACAVTPTGGRHWFFTVRQGDDIPRNLKLAYAQDESGFALLAEVRGEGGQVAVPPGDGRGWAGDSQPGNAVVVTRQQLDLIFDSFRAIDEAAGSRMNTPKRNRTGFTTPNSASVADVLANALLNGEITWADVLDPGWHLTGHDSEGRSLWLRPDYGNKPTSLFSAKGYEHHDPPSPVFVCHSAAVEHLPQGEGQALTPGRVLAYSWFGGDEAKAYEAIESGLLPEGLHLPESVRNAVAAYSARKQPAQPVETPESPPTGTFMDDAIRQQAVSEYIRQEARDRVTRARAGQGITLPPSTFDGREYLDLPDEGVDWALDGLLPAFGNATLTASFKSGKGLSVDEPILTPDGWKRMGDLREGDAVYAPDGQATKVEFVSGIHHRDCYRVTLRDGRSIIADDQHLWTVVSQSSKKVSVIDTATLSRNAISKHGQAQWLLDLPEAIDLPERHLPVDPHLLGLWLGDGDKRDGIITIGEADLDYYMRVIASAGCDATPRESKPGTWRIGVYGLRTDLRSLGVLRNKHVPEDYLLGSIEQRKALLAGLMDSDGSAESRANGSGAVEFSSATEALADAVAFLARSLGWKPTRSLNKSALYGVERQPRHRVRWSAWQGERDPFRLPRKSAALGTRNVTTKTRSDRVAIAAVERVPTVPTIYIKVEHPSAMFIAGRDLIPTHNTTTMGDLIRSLADGEPFLGKFAPAPLEGRVALWNYELGRDQQKRWLRDLGIGHPEKFCVLDLRGTRFPLINEHAETMAVQWLAEREVEWWIIDPFARAFVGCGDENSNADVSIFLDTLDVIKQRSGVKQIVMPVHTGRPGLQPNDVRARGAARLDDWPDSRWLLFRDEDTNARFFSAQGRDVDVDEEQVVMDDMKRLCMSGWDREGYRVKVLTDQVCDAVRDAPGITKVQIQEAVQGKTSEVRAALDRALGLRLIVPDDKGGYQSAFLVRGE
jgi:hypothetical protein